MPYITPDGSYTESPYVAEGSIEVPVRPGPEYRWTGEWVVDLEYQIAQLRKEIDDAEREKMQPHGLRVFMIGSMEKEAQELGAARVPPLNKAQSIAALRAGNVGYRVLMEFHELIAALEAQIAALEAQL